MHAKPGHPAPRTRSYSEMRRSRSTRLPAQVFEALTNPNGSWLGGGTRSEWRPNRPACTKRRFRRGWRLYDSTNDRRAAEALVAWPLAKEDRTVVTTVAYELYPRGPQTAIHVTHHSPRSCRENGPPCGQQALESLKSYLEAGNRAQRDRLFRDWNLLSGVFGNSRVHNGTKISRARSSRTRVGPIRWKHRSAFG